MALVDHDYTLALTVWDDAAALLTYLGPRVSQDDYPRVEAMYDRLVSNRLVAAEQAGARAADAVGLPEARRFLLEGGTHDAG